MVKNVTKKKGNKMEANFIGPFIVKKRSPFGTYEITTLEGEDHQSRVAINDISSESGERSIL